MSIVPRRTAFLAMMVTLAATGLACIPARAQETKVGIGISGWTGFAPLTLP